MKRSTVLKLAIEAIDKRIKVLAPNANLYELLKMESGKRAYREVHRLKEARKDLEQELEGLNERDR